MFFNEEIEYIDNCIQKSKERELSQVMSYEEYRELLLSNFDKQIKKLTKEVLNAR